MQTQVNPIPQGYHSLTPYLMVKDAARAIDFYIKAFGAKEMFRIDAKEGKVGHCELQIGDSHIMLADETSNSMGSASASGNGEAFSLLLYVKNVDDIFKRAIEAGAIEVRAVKDEFFGDRMGTIQDPFGHKWNLATHIEDVSPQEMKNRAAKVMH